MAVSRGRKKKAKKVKKIGKEKKGESFEKLVAVIQSVLNKQATIIHNVKITQVSSSIRQIDVLIVNEDKTQKKLIVECKDKGKPVAVSEMDSFIQLCTTTDSDGMFFSKSGFQKGALVNGAYSNIKLFTLKKITESDIERLIFNPDVFTFQYNHKIKETHFVINPANNHLMPFTPEDNFLYNVEESIKVTQDDFAEYCLTKFLKANQFSIYFPIVSDFNDTKNKDVLGKEHIGKCRIDLVTPHYYKYKDSFILIDFMLCEFVYSVTANQTTKEIAIHKDINNNIVTKSVMADITYNNLPYSVTLVENKEGEFKVALVPKFRSSEIIYLNILGQIQKK